MLTCRSIEVVISIQKGKDSFFNRIHIFAHQEKNGIGKWPFIVIAIFAGRVMDFAASRKEMFITKVHRKRAD